LTEGPLIQARRRQSICGRRLLLSPPLHRGRYAHGFAIFRNRAAGDVDTGFPQLLDDRIVGQYAGGAFAVDQLLNAVTYRLGRMSFAAMGGGNRLGEEIFQLENAAACGHVFVCRDARYGRFMHADGLGDRLQVERAQMLNAASEE